MTRLRLKELLREFEASFGAYVDETRDVRFETLSNLLRQASTDAISTLFESHDFAALLTNFVYVDARHASRCTDLRKEGGVSEEILREVLVVNDKYVPLKGVIDQLMTTEEGREMLLDVACCLAKAHHMDVVRENLWKP